MKNNQKKDDRDGWIWDIGESSARNRLALMTINPDSFDETTIQLWKDGNGFAYKFPEGTVLSESARFDV